MRTDQLIVEIAVGLEFIVVLVLSGDTSAMARPNQVQAVSSL
jgi:hypothetical protein